MPRGLRAQMTAVVPATIVPSQEEDQPIRPASFLGDEVGGRWHTSCASCPACGLYPPSSRTSDNTP